MGAGRAPRSLHGGRGAPYSVGSAPAPQNLADFAATLFGSHGVVLDTNVVSETREVRPQTGGQRLAAHAATGNDGLWWHQAIRRPHFAAIEPEK